jgi:hypothetical protein
MREAWPVANAGSARASCRGGRGEGAAFRKNNPMQSRMEGSRGRSTGQEERDAGWQVYPATVAPDFVSLIQIAYFRQLSRFGKTCRAVQKSRRLHQN